MQKKVKALIISGSILTGLAMTIGLTVLVGNLSYQPRNGENVTFCAKKIGKTAFLEEKSVKINNHEFFYYNVISGKDGSWILLDKTSYIINTDISYGLRYKNDELIDIKPYAGSKEPVKIPSSDLYPGYSNYEINHGFKLSIKDSIEDESIPNGVNIGVIMHWCQQK